MTPEERAAKVAAWLVVDDESWEPRSLGDVERLIAAEIRAAVDDERAECAKVAKETETACRASAAIAENARRTTTADFRLSDADTAQSIGDLIRARGAK